MSRLHPLRARLTSLQRARAFVRNGAGWAAAAVTLALALAVVFVLDWQFRLGVPERVVVLLLAVAGIVWSWRKYTLPFVGVKEDLVQMALLVERQQQIDSDLVAALQFEGAPATAYGSTQLKTAVVDYVAQAAPGINVFDGFDRSVLVRRGWLFLITAAAVAAAVVMYPDHLRVFFQRLALGSQHYPSQTRIVEVRVNDKLALEALHWTDALQPKEIRCPQGEPVTFVVRCGGVIPKDGVAELSSLGQAAGGTTVELTRVGETDEFRGELGRLVDGVHYTLKLGDAFTDSAILRLVPLPVVEPTLKTTPPSYARHVQPPEETSARQIGVLEGTKIGLSVACTNKKVLTDARLLVKTRETTTEHPLQKADAAGHVWQLPGEGTPLSVVHSELQYELQVTDEDGLQLETPIRGQIRLRQDRPPLVTADIIHKVVLPAAEPVIDYRVADDFGLSAVRIGVEVERKEDATGDTADAPPTSESTEPGKKREVERATAAVLAPNARIAGTDLPLVGKFPVKLSQLAFARGPLKKGDRVKLVVEAADDRGDAEGMFASSEPLFLEISDESGVLQAISEADKKSEERLTDLIKRQLGIGESP